MTAIYEEQLQRFEIHYFLEGGSHSIDAQARLISEEQFLGILKEVAKYYDVDVFVEAESLIEGGVRNRWVLIGQNVLIISAVLSALFTGVAAIATSIQAFNSFPTEQDEKLKDLQIKKLEAELQQLGLSQEQSTESVKKVVELEANNKIRKKRSNLYTAVQSVDKVTNIGFSVLDSKSKPVINELVIPRSQFNQFILHSNNLPDETDHLAVIEIVSPVLKEGKTKWRGVYNGELITFNMKDAEFKKDVLLGKYSFQHGTIIEAVLEVYKELDEVGEEKIVDRSVTVVIRKVDGSEGIETTQGKVYRHTKKLESSQQNLAFNDE